MSWYIWGVTSFDVPLLLDQSLICMKFSRYILTVLSVIRKLKAFWTLWPLVNPAFILTVLPSVMGGTHSVPLCSDDLCGWGFVSDFRIHHFLFWSGSHLLSHAVSSIVPSAAQVLTIVFGMGTGVSPERIATGNISLFTALLLCSPDSFDSTSFHLRKVSRPIRLRTHVFTQTSLHHTCLLIRAVLVDNSTVN